MIGRAIMLALGLLAASPARAEERADCTPRSATTATVAAIAGDPPAWTGRCVTVTAVGSGRWLYESVDGFYRLSREPGDPASNGLRLGLDNLTRTIAGFPELTVTGRVQDCEAARQAVEASAKAGEIAMIAGYCHYFSGAYLWVEKARRGPAKPFERRTRVRGEGYGDLSSGSDAWARRALVEQKSSAFLAAVVARDRQALAELMAPDPTDALDLEAARKAAADVLGRSSVFKALGLSSQRIVLRRRGAGDDGLDAFACFCRTADCTGRWPIASFDVDNLPSRPYACIRVADYVVFQKGLRPVIMLPEVEAGLKEPAQAAAAPL